MPKDDSIRKHSKQKEHVFDKLASPKHSIFLLSYSKPDCRQWALVLRQRSKVGQVTSDSEAGPLQPQRASRETCLPWRVSASKWPTRLSSSGTNSWTFFFQINNTYFVCGALSVSPTTASTSSPPWKHLWMRWDAQLPEGARQGPASLSSILVSPGNHTPVSHHTFTLTLHYPGANNRKAGMKSQLKKKKKQHFQSSVKELKWRVGKNSTVWKDSEHTETHHNCTQFGHEVWCHRIIKLSYNKAWQPIHSFSASQV